MCSTMGDGDSLKSRFIEKSDIQESGLIEEGFADARLLPLAKTFIP